MRSCVFFYILLSFTTFNNALKNKSNKNNSFSTFDTKTVFICYIITTAKRSKIIVALLIKVDKISNKFKYTVFLCMNILMC